MLTFRAMDSNDYNLVKTIRADVVNLTTVNQKAVDLLQQQLRATQETNRQLDRLATGFGFDANGRKDFNYFA